MADHPTKIYESDKKTDICKIQRKKKWNIVIPAYTQMKYSIHCHCTILVTTQEINLCRWTWPTIVNLDLNRWDSLNDMCTLHVKTVVKIADKMGVCSWLLHVYCYCNSPCLRHCLKDKHTWTFIPSEGYVLIGDFTSLHVCTAESD